MTTTWLRLSDMCGHFVEFVTLQDHEHPPLVDDFSHNSGYFPGLCWSPGGYLLLFGKLTEQWGKLFCLLGRSVNWALFFAMLVQRVPNGKRTAGTRIHGALENNVSPQVSGSVTVGAFFMEQNMNNCRFCCQFSRACAHLCFAILAQG